MCLHVCVRSFPCLSLLTCLLLGRQGKTTSSLITQFTAGHALNLKKSQDFSLWRLPNPSLLSPFPDVWSCVIVHLSPWHLLDFMFWIFTVWLLGHKSLQTRNEVKFLLNFPEGLGHSKCSVNVDESSALSCVLPNSLQWTACISQGHIHPSLIDFQSIPLMAFNHLTQTFVVSSSFLKIPTVAKRLCLWATWLMVLKKPLVDYLLRARFCARLLPGSQCPSKWSRLWRNEVHQEVPSLATKLSKDQDSFGGLNLNLFKQWSLHGFIITHSEVQNIHIFF